MKFSTHEAMYEQAKKNCDVLLIENVPEYDIKTMVRRKLGAGWKVREACIDPRHFGMGASRPRRYGLAWKQSSVMWDVRFNLEDVLECLKAVPQMTALSYYNIPSNPSTLTMAEARRPR